MVNIYEDICFVLFVIQMLVECSTTTYITRGKMDKLSSDIVIDNLRKCNLGGRYCKCARFETLIYYKDRNERECVQNSEYMSDCDSYSDSKRIKIVPSGSLSSVNFTFDVNGSTVMSCHWQRTGYTEYGVDYTTLPPESNPGEISVKDGMFVSNTKILQISNPDKLLSTHPGNLLQLHIGCNEFMQSGPHTTEMCLLLKIEGRKYITTPQGSSTLPTMSSTLSIPSLTSSPTSSMTSSPTPLLLTSSSISPTTQISDMAVTPQAKSLNTNPSPVTTKLSTSPSSTTTISLDPGNGKRKGEENDLVLILVPTLLMFVLIVVVLVGLLIYRKRQSKSMSRNIEESSDDDSNTLPHHATLTKKPQDASQAYAVPESQINSLSLLLICRRRSKSLSRNIEKGSDDDNNTLPHHATLTKKSQVSSQVYTVPGSQINTTPVYDNVHENAPNHYEFEYDYATCDAPAQTISDSTSPQSIYQEIDNLDGVPESNVKSEDNLYVDESKENPYYHSLEDETSKGNIYEEAQTN